MLALPGGTSQASGFLAKNSANSLVGQNMAQITPQ
jgi:hypothetical protein